MDFKNKSVLITGGCSGIGKIMARKSLERGAAKLIIWDINEDALTQTKNDFSALGGEIFIYKVDVFNLDEIKVRWKKVAFENCTGVRCTTGPGTGGAFSCGTSTVADIDGNSYHTVSIGTQC